MPDKNPADEQDLPFLQVEQIDRLCDQFEQEWLSGTRPKIEEYLDRADTLHRTVLLAELVAAECAVRQRSGENVTIEEYRQRFAAHLETVEAGWKLFAGSRSAAAGVSTTKNRAPALDSTQTIPPRKGRAPDELPKQIGRYRVDRLLGEGAFGAVYLANDDQLKRAVAIKVPHANLISRPEDAQAYLLEAQTLASLDHPHIVPVYDVGSTDEYPCYVVSKFIEGTNLAELVKQEPLTDKDAAQLIATIADALQHTHNRGLVHRDIKPANILIDTSGNTFVADFGLALRDEDFGKSATFAGTPAYMSPEQARGEGHRVDGRSDIFSLGVVLYELLTGSRPFCGDDIHAVLDNIVNVEARPPRHLKESISKELERICLKALSKRATDRYASAVDMADDLRHCNDVATSTEDAAKPIKIVPKGLRSFDASDSDFFLELLPGARDRDGLPESIRFWKTRIEETDADKAFSVGLLYGPSGCGKSSLVKAGLLPRLADHVSCVFVEATPDETETRLLNGLRKTCPDLPRDWSLPDTIAALRRGRGIPAGRKVLVVLDQLEQWLHAERNEKTAELVEALRHCEGGRVQCLLMVRDDFWMPVSEFMDQLEVRKLDGHNSVGVPLFDTMHAHKVLGSFGQALGRIPENLGSISTAQQQFLDEAVQALAGDGKVISVRLALFAEMMKGKPWNPASLQAVGGAEGVGVTFLEETFNAKTAPPVHRLHQKAARAVLKALLPESGTDIKGSMRSYDELLATSGYEARKNNFDDLLRILDTEIRLITPTDPEGASDDEDTSVCTDPGQGYYQLTHDYLVPSLRDWLTRKQKETRRGRAELRLAERSAQWNAKAEKRYLPSIWEWASIRGLTRQKNWSQPQQKMMARAGRWHGLRLTLGLLLLTTLSFAGLRIRDAVVDTNSDERATGLVTALVNADIEQVPGILGDLPDFRQWADSKLRDQLREFDEASNERLNISLALLPVDPTQLGYLENRLLHAKPEQVETIRALLADRKTDMIAKLWQVAEKPEAGEEAQLLQAASALATYDPDNEARWSPIADRVVDALVRENSLRAATWIKTLKPARRQLIKPLSVVYSNEGGKRSQTEIELATGALEAYAADDVETLAALILEGDPKQFAALFERGFSSMTEELDKELTCAWNDPPLDPTWTEPAANVADKIRRAHGMITDHFAFCQTMPIEEFESVADQFGKSGYRPVRLRPYDCGSSVQVAAAWSRDGRYWRCLTAQTADELRQMDEGQRNEGFVAVDVAGYVGQRDEQPADRYVGLWVKKRDVSEEARIIVGVPYAELTTVGETLAEEGFSFLHSIQGYRGVDAQVKFCTVTTRASGESTACGLQSGSSFDALEYLDRVLWDIDVNDAPDPQTTKQRRKRALPDAEVLLNEKPDDLSARYTCAEARYFLQIDESCLDEDYLELEEEADLDPRRNIEAFPKPMKGANLDVRYSAIWNTNDRFDSLKSHGLSPAEHVGDCKNLSLQGYRPVSVSAARINGKIVTASVWHRPRVPGVDRNRLAHRQAKAAIALLRQGRSEPAREMMERSRKDPEALTQFVHRSRGSGVTVLQLLDALEQCVASRQSAEGEARKRKDHVLYGILLSLGEFDLLEIPQPHRQDLADRLLDWYATHPSSAVHGACGWLLRRWGFEGEVTRVDQTPLAYDESGEREWYVIEIDVSDAGATDKDQRVFFTFVVFPPGEFVMGSPSDEQGHVIDEAQHRVKLTSPLAVSDREVTWGQFTAFDKGTHQASWEKRFLKRLTVTDPAFGVNWFEAVSYCRWLTTQAGISESDQCYAEKTIPQHKLGRGWVDLPDSTEWSVNLVAGGFRLLTNSEWEYVGRSGTSSAFSFGDDRTLLGRYAWHRDNSEGWSHRVGLLRPNPRGLFDIEGNVGEWCHDWYDGGVSRHRRGGSWCSLAASCRMASCSGHQPSYRSYYLGFRLAVVPSGERASKRVIPQRAGRVPSVTPRSGAEGSRSERSDGGRTGALLYPSRTDC